jgi:DNA-binding transcriptional MerR regulator
LGSSLRQRVGCSFDDIRQLLSATDGRLAAPAAWKALQVTRLRALDETIADATALRDLINAGVSGCGRATLGECAIALGITRA